MMTVFHRLIMSLKQRECEDFTTNNFGILQYKNVVKLQLKRVKDVREFSILIFFFFSLPVGESGAKWACGAKWAPSI